jgi:hypothetical protein
VSLKNVRGEFSSESFQQNQSSEERKDLAFKRRQQIGRSAPASGRVSRFPILCSAQTGLGCERQERKVERRTSRKRKSLLRSRGFGASLAGMLLLLLL